MGYDPLSDVAEDITKKLARRWALPRRSKTRDSDVLMDLVLQGLTRKAVELLSEGGISEGSLDDDLEVRFQRIEKKLDRLMTALTTTGAVRIEDDDHDEDEDTGTSKFPNLKYAKPKYNHVGTLLKYIEKEDDTAGVKLVIMNFND